MDVVRSLAGKHGRTTDVPAARVVRPAERNFLRIGGVLLGLLLGAVVSPALATTWWVRTDGSDASCDGKQDAPASSGPGCAFATVRHCYEVMAAGDTCRIGPGVFNDLPASWNKTTSPVTLSGTLSCNHGSTRITGTGTAFTKQIHPGDYVRCDKDPDDTDLDYRVQKYVPWTRVEEVVSDTELRLAEGYRGASSAGTTGRVARFYRIVGAGMNRTILTNYQRLSLLPHEDFHRLTGVDFDCDRAADGKQDCTNVWTFCAPHAGDSSAQKPSMHPVGGSGAKAGHAGIQVHLGPEAVDDDDVAVGASLSRPRGLRPYSQWVGARYLESAYQPPATSEYVIAWTNRWPGTMAVVLDTVASTGCQTPGYDRWYFHPRETISSAEDVWIGDKDRRNSLWEGSYHEVSDLTLLAAEEHRGDKDADRHGFQLGASGGSHLIFRRIRVLGNAWPYAIRGTHTRIAVEDSIVTMGPIGNAGEWMGFYRVRFLGGFPRSGEMQPFGTNESLSVAPVFDSCRLFGGSAYFGDRKYTSSSSWCYDFDQGTHRPQWDGCGTHGPIFHGEVGDPRNKYAWWINNILECGTGEIVTHPAEDAGFVFVNNTVGRSCGFSYATVTHWQYDRTATDTRNAGGNVIRNNVYLWFDAPDAPRQFYDWYEDDVYETAVPDYNAYFAAVNRSTIHEHGPAEVRVDLAGARADGKDLHSISRVHVSLASLFADPDWTDNPEEGADYTPLRGNPAIDAGDGKWCPSYDYYGHPRNDGACDIGAVEVAGTPQCSDGRDNDGDGKIDYPDDSGCASASDDSEAVCGDGRIDPGEECDGNDLGGQTCESLGHDGGTLGCTPSCTRDESRCEDAPSRVENLHRTDTR